MEEVGGGGGGGKRNKKRSRLDQLRRRIYCMAICHQTRQSTLKKFNSNLSICSDFGAKRNIDESDTPACIAYGQ